MFEKKYQFFISSTYEDLKEERNRLFWAVLKKKHIPIGMELFGAVDEEQMTYIKRLIDDCDCYVILLGGRYGSVNKDGISYTEQEYDYAVQKGLKVIALVHKDPESLPPEKRDNSEELRKKFMVFHRKVLGANRLAAQWENLTDLVENFHISIDETINNIPMVGWVRGNIPASHEDLQSLEVLKEENQRLQEIVKRTGEKQIASDVKMEAFSVTNPDVVSDVEIECVSLDINCQVNNFFIHSLFLQYPNRFSHESVDYCIGGILPWFTQIAKVCRIDFRITNPFQFPIKNMRFEQHMFNENGEEVKIPDPDDVIQAVPNNPALGVPSILSKPTQIDSVLNPRQTSIYTHTCYYVPSRNRDLIYQKKISAENILDPIKKSIKVHFRIKAFDCNIKDMILCFYNLACRKKLNDAGVFEFVRDVLAKEGKEQDSCDTQK